MPHTRQDTENFKRDLYWDAIADGIESLLLTYDFALASDKKLAEALCLRDIPCTCLTVARVRKERGIPHAYARMRQHKKDAHEWAANQEIQS